MAVASLYNTSSPYRDLCMKNILYNCSEKKWSVAEDLADKYVDYCKKYWEEYDTTHLNYKFNKCGNCFKQKQSVVKLEWPESEKYPFSGQLVCMNYTCKFYLIVNVDQYNFLALE